MNNDAARSKYAIEQIGLLYEVEHKADDENLTCDERRDLRMRLAVPILQTFEVWLKNEAPKVLPKSPIGKAINYAIDHYDRLCRYVIDGRYRIDTNLVENGQRIFALTRKNYIFCKNHDAAEDATVMYTIMGCCKLAGVNVEAWLTYFLDHVHEYDNDYSLDIADFLPSNLVSKGLLKTSENLRKSLKRLQSLRNNYTWFTECLQINLFLSYFVRLNANPRTFCHFRLICPAKRQSSGQVVTSEYHSRRASLKTTKKSESGAI